MADERGTPLKSHGQLQILNVFCSVHFLSHPMQNKNWK